MLGKQRYMQELDERSFVEEMLHNREAKNWEKCLEFVKPLVYAKTKDMRTEDQEDIIQEVMYKVVKYLPNFRFECTLRTWLFPIIDHCIKDKHRTNLRKGLLHEERLYHFFVEHLNEEDNTGEDFRAKKEISAEEVFEIHEKIRIGVKAVLEYARVHAKPDRNLLIIQTVILEGQTNIEAARRAGCDEGVIGYVVREAQRYARERLND